MKIAIVCYPTFGGSGVVATELGLALALQGHEIHFITYKQPVRLEALSENLHFHEVNVPDYPLFHFQPYELALSSKLVDMVKLHQIELMHVHYAIPHAYAAYMAKKMLQDQGINLPIVTTLHGTDITLVGSHPFYKSAVAFSINHSDCVTSVSESLKKDTLDLFDIRKDIMVIPNFVDFEKHSSHNEDCERHVIAPAHERIISHVSNFRFVKRILDVIRVFEKIVKEVPAKLIMVGEGPDKQAAMDYCQEHGIADSVKFIGKSNQVFEVLCYSDLFILPSETESFGLAALEAMMMRVPVISTNTGGLSEVNVEGKTGYLFDVGDVKAMAEKSIALLQDEVLLEEFKNNAQKEARKFDLNQIVGRYVAVYQQALASH
ncbi:MAG: N-acetyl-alpha-D-glucosaminyl L-malate synthase BshA [Flavobacteriaceae bacterium]|nr:N-acetyl-alpha-D-glucosaminyl L-malate synthase BshA [Flavobacteriaceae bacterium]MDG1090318.1 N-acetyl-alpha-D-glucosaminyl L-malate synthase BshA [Flavobacteriaceae bacterium]